MAVIATATASIVMMAILLHVGNGVRLDGQMVTMPNDGDDSSMQQTRYQLLQKRAREQVAQELEDISSDEDE